jgi:1,4-dihydroxy-2-naphthoyl-CoA hydrolase
MTQETLSLMPFAAACGIEIVEASKSEVRARMPWREDLCTTNGILHGGALMTFADTIGALCAFLNLPEGAGTGTLASSTSFLRAVREGEVTATAAPLHAGRSTIVVRTDLRDAQGKLVATTTQTQAVLAAP